MARDDEFDLAFQEPLTSDEDHDYVNLQHLGKGGSAATYLVQAANGPFQGMFFAAKVFRRLSMPERRVSFLNEAQFLRECDFPGIMRLYAQGDYGNHPFVVAEYLPQTLADVISSGKPTMVDKLSYVVQLVSTLAFLECQTPPIVHRDIKPQNVFVKGRSCVLGDFGLMKRLDGGDEPDRERAIKESVGPGMPLQYRTPDLVAYLHGEAVLTSKSDLFQTGLVAAELFTGHNPQILAENRDFGSAVRLDPLGRIPGRFAGWIRNNLAAMLELDPQRRPSALDSLANWRELFLAAAVEEQAGSGRVFQRAGESQRPGQRGRRKR